VLHRRNHAHPALPSLGCAAGLGTGSGGDFQGTRFIINLGFPQELDVWLALISFLCLSRLEPPPSKQIRICPAVELLEPPSYHDCIIQQDTSPAARLPPKFILLLSPLPSSLPPEPRIFLRRAELEDGGSVSPPKCRHQRGGRCQINLYIVGRLYEQGLLQVSVFLRGKASRQDQEG
jgi:hypothetical protein